MWKFQGEGVSSTSSLERKLQRGGGGCKPRNLPWEGYGYFLEPHIHIYYYLIVVMFNYNM